MLLDYKEKYLSDVGIETKSKPPALNENYMGSTASGLTTRPYDYKKIMQYVKKSPEALGVIKTIVTDIISDGWVFNGKKKYVTKAEEFAEVNGMKDELKAALIDWLIEGNLALWLGISDIKAKEALGRIQEIEYKAEEYIGDEAWTWNKKFKHVAWTTMNIVLNKEGTEIDHYEQNVTHGSSNVVDSTGSEIPGKSQTTGLNKRIWQPDEIIHGKYLQIDGKAYGYSPMISLMPEISTLQQIKDYAGNFFGNSGVPDWMFILPTETINSQNVAKFRQTIRQWQDSSAKHRNLVLAGEVKPERLNQFDKDMEFKVLAIYYVATIGFAFNLPMGKMQSILGMEQKGKESELSGEAYYRSISEAQDYIERLLNVQLFKKYFKVEFHFNKSYLQDEIREAQNKMFITDYLTKLMGVGKFYKKKPSDQYINKILQMKDEDWSEMTKEEMELMNPNTERQGQQSNAQLTGNNPRESQTKKDEKLGEMERKKIKPQGS